MNLRKSFLLFVGRQSKEWLLIEAVALVAVIGVLDYATGYEVSFFPFYSIPILLVLWLAGTAPAVFICVLSALAWWCADRATGHVYSREWLRLWDSIVRLMFFYLILLAGANVRRQRDVNRARIELLERSQKLEQDIIATSEREQQRIGRDLHDSLGQHLVAIALAADSLKDALVTESPGPAKSVGQLADLLHGAVTLTRDLARGLSPVDRDEGGLASALEQLVTRTARLSGIPCIFHAEGTLDFLDNAEAVHIYRIAQEALNNAIKHARPSSVLVALATRQDCVHLEVKDDGIGMDPVQSSSAGMGLNIMRYRARMLGGSLEIERSGTGGTLVSCVIRPSSSANENKLSL